MYDITVRHVTRVLSPAQLRLLQRGTRSRYIKWCEKNRMPVTIEESGEGGRLLWVGEKRIDRVVLFFHGKFESSWLNIPPSDALIFVMDIQEAGLYVR